MPNRKVLHRHVAKAETARLRGLAHGDGERGSVANSVSGIIVPARSIDRMEQVNLGEGIGPRTAVFVVCEPLPA